MRSPLLLAFISLWSPLLLAADKPALVITESAIQQAIKDTLAETPAEPAAKTSLPAYRAVDRTEARMTQAFIDAKVPDCLHPDAMKFTPPHIGPIGLVGIYATPFWAYAALSGKCR